MQRLIELGSFEALHPRSDWDGHVIEASSTPGQEGDFFRGQYRLCEFSCEEAAFPSAYIFHQRIAGQDWLVWTWVGDYSSIDGFKVYINGSHQFTVSNTTNSTPIVGYEPVCGARYEFEITAYEGDRESPRSNSVVLEGEPCPKTVQVTFERLITFDLRDDEESNKAGPISGSFWAQGSNFESLGFNADDYPHGFFLNSNSNPSVMSIFSWILGQMSMPCEGSSCPMYYRAPGVDFVSIEIGSGDDLTVGGIIHQQDWRVYNTIFNGSQTFAFDEILPGRYTIRDQQIELVFWIDVLVSSEVGDAPDLMITNVDQHETSGQLRFQVFNNGGTMVDQNVTIRLLGSDSGDLVYSQHWENITLTSGETRLFQDVVTDIEPYGVTAVIDPDNRIVESNDDNNTFVTPVLMRVQLMKLFVGSPCESFLSCDTEHWFTFYTGHGTTRSEVTWVGHSVRYPVSDTIILDTCDFDANLDWRPADEDARFTIEFPVPHEENLYVMIAGYEKDAFTDDFMGYINASYGPDENYGHDEDLHHARSSGPGVSDCDDGITPVGWDYFGFEAWWRITRLSGLAP
jgi:hypothetical protein